MESQTGESAQEQLDSLAAGRERALGRMFVPWPYVVAWAVLMNGLILPVVLPILLSDDWTLLVQGAFLVAMTALLLTQLSRHGVKKPRVRVHGAWILNVVIAVSLASALALAVYARSVDNPWLGATALLLNFVGYLVAYGGLGFLLRRQLARLP